MSSSPSPQPTPLRPGDQEREAPASAPATASETDEPSETDERRTSPVIPWVLAGLLLISLLLLAWSRAQLGERVIALEDEARNLREAVAERDRTIDAQRARLGDVRTRVEDLLQTLDTPLED